ncbi:MAG: phosphate acetyltransferase [Gemmatimonadota bacterium]|nr:phosphate acetyltransferase [Gemmatimonadota bacterium]
MSFTQELRGRAARSRRRILFPESGDERTLAAVRVLLADHIVDPVLVLDPTDPASHRAARDTGAEILDSGADDRSERIAERLWTRRRDRGLTREAAARVVRDPLWFADGLVAAGEADGCVAGATHTTADVLRAALWSVGPAAGATTVSSAFYMSVEAFRADRPEVLTFTDCAVVPEPTVEQLADIALAAAADRRRIVGDEPRVAMLSFSTRGSGTGPSPARVRAAVELARARAPDLLVDGELQGDAALIAEVGRRKAGDGAVAGRANVLVFPSLDAGNIAYKLVERIARCSAIGPILQGLARPCSDLSRGASSDDIINVAAITALQAAGPEPPMAG